MPVTVRHRDLTRSGMWRGLDKHPYAAVQEELIIACLEVVQEGAYYNY